MTAPDGPDPVPTAPDGATPPSRAGGRVIGVGFSMALATLVVNALLSYANLGSVARNHDLVDRSREAIRRLGGALSMLKDAETGQRGYLLTGEDRYLGPYRAAVAGLGDRLDGLDGTIADDPGQRARMVGLRALVDEKMAELGRTVALRGAGGQEAALEVVRADRGRALMEEARRVVGEMEAEEGRLLARRDEEARAATRRTIAAIAVATGVALALLIAAAALRRREAAGRELAATAIRRSEAWLSTVLTSVGDGLIATDERGRVRFLNPIAQAMTGWSQAEASGRPMGEVFRIVNEQTRLPAEDPVARVIRRGVILGLANHTLLVSRDGAETPIDDSAAPIKDGSGAVVGAVLVFRDIAGRRRQEAELAEQRRLAEFGRDIGIILTQSASLGEMLARSAEATVAHLDGAFARIWTVDESGEVLELQASAGLYTHVDGPHARVPVGQFKIGQIARDRKPHLTNAVIGDPRVPAQDWARREGMVAFAGYPLVVEGRLVGVWAMFARHPLTEATIQRMASVANQIGLGIETRRAEGRLRREREWLRVTLSSVGDAIITTDVEGRVTFLNPVAEALTGWPEAEAAGLPLVDVFRIVNESSREPVESPAGRALREGAIVGLANHTVLISRDGSERSIDDSAAPIRDESGAVVGAVLVFRDVHDRREAERSLEESERQFRSLADSIPQLAWMARADGHIYWYNRRWYEYTGTGPEEMAGWGWQSVHDPEALPAVLERWRGSIADGQPFDMVFPLRGADGLFRPFLTRVMPIRGDDGAVVQWFGTNTDIAERQQMLDQLRAAKEEAEHANTAKDQFLAVLSHELRTPLNPILLAASSMLDRPTPPEEVRPTLEMIRHNVSIQARLIDDLLDVMRIVQGKMPLHWGVADCHAVIRHAVQVCQSEIYGKAIGLTLELDAGHHHLNADAARLEQVFWNLIKNAVKFSPEGGKLAIRTRNPEGDPGRLEVEVADTGIGIRADVLPKIFDPFQQGESSITRRFGGLGLGLAIGRGIVEAHGGEITARSEGEGLGTTFRIVLNVLPTPEPDGTGRPRDPEAVREPAGPADALKILVVEDEPATQRLMARLLRALGHDVTAAGTIAEGMEAAQAVPFDLIVSDIGLPDGSGLELMRRVVALRGSVRSIALTGYGMEEDIVRSRDAGFTAHMTKPIDFTKLEAMIQQITSRQAQADAGTRPRR